MKRIFLSLAVLLSAVFVFTSCLNSDDNATYYGDTAITSFSMSNSLTYYEHTISSVGTDSISDTTTVTSSNYKFNIDQSKGEIYNQDSLPYGTKVDRILISASSYNSGTITVKNVDSDTLLYYSSSDSLDFTEPRIFRVYSQDGTSFRNYTVKVNVHKQNGDLFNWSGQAVNAKLAALTAMKGVAFNGKIFVAGLLSGQTKLYATSENDVNGWNEITPNITLNANAYNNMVANSNYIYTYNDGNIVKSKDGETWETVASVSITQLIGATDNRLYAIADGTMKSSTDDGATWSEDGVEDESEYLPSQNINMVSLAAVTNKNTNDVIMVGNRANSYTQDSVAVVWKKVEENSSDSENQKWYYYNSLSNENRYSMPRLKNLQVVKFGDNLIAFGGEGLGASTAKAYSKFYVSGDEGTTWKKSSNVLPPSGFSAGDAFTMISDSNNFIWVICGQSGQVWKGRLNSLGWAKSQTAFTE